MRTRGATLVIVLAVVASACDTSATSPSPGVSGSPSPAPSARDADPDVLTYKGDAARHGLMPGPALRIQPQELWIDDAGAGFNAAPLVRDGIVYAIDGAVVRSWDLATGIRLDWAVELPAPPAGAPTIADDLLYVVTDDRTVRAYALSDGEEAWSVQGAGGGGITVDGGLLVVGRDGGGMLGLGARTGDERWSTDHGSVIRTSLGGGRAYGSGDSGALTVVDEQGAGTTIDLDAARVLTPSVDPDEIIVIANGGGGGDVLLGLESDLRVQWRYPVDAGDLGAHAVTDDRIVLTIAGPTRVVSLDRATREVQWERPLPGAERTSIPVIADGVIYVIASGIGLVALDESDGTILWTWAYGGWFPYGVTVTDGVVLLAPDGALGFTELIALADPDDPRHAGVPARSVDPSAAIPPPFAISAERDVDPDSLFLGMARAPDGTIYLADMAKHRVVVLPPDGGAPVLWDRRGAAAGEFDFSEVATNSQSTGVAVSRDGALVAVGDGGNRRVQVFEAVSGDVVRVIGRLGRSDGQFVNPCCPAFDADGRLWVTDTERADLQVFDVATGKHLLTVGAPGDGDGQLSRPGGPVIVGDEVFVPDFANRRVAVFSTGGRWLRNHGDRPEDGLILGEVNEVVVDAAGRMYVHTTRNDIDILDRDGHLVATLRPWEIGLDEPAEIGPIAVDPDGRRLVFVELLGGRLITVDLDPSIWPAT